MKATFAEYYEPSPQELEILWQEATVVFDTNVLLEPYGLPKDGREALLGLLRELKERVWIPHQVGLEFQRNRLRVIASERDRTNKALDSTKSKINNVIEQIRGLALHERGIDVDPGRIIDELKSALGSTYEALEKAHKAQLTPALADPIREELDKIFAGRIGQPFLRQTEIDEICKEGSVRYAQQVPPGFEDESKEEERFTHAGLLYTNKYGDLLLWKQLLAYAKAQSIEKLIFVTLEKKDDWWQTRDKSIIGPRPELLRELTHEGGIRSCWIVRLPEFMTKINNYLVRKISPIAIDQVEASDANRIEYQVPQHYISPTHTAIAPAVKAIEQWLANHGYGISPDPLLGGFDLVAIGKGEVLGVEVVLSYSMQPDAMASHLAPQLMSVTESKLRAHGVTQHLFVVVLVPPPDNSKLGTLARAAAEAKMLIHQKSGTETKIVDIVFGTILSDVFVLL